MDQYGLKSRFLRKHKKEVARFFRDKVETESSSDLAAKFKSRFMRNEGRLFTFLDYDGIPWNNNNAENAIKGFCEDSQGSQRTCKLRRAAKDFAFYSV